MFAHAILNSSEEIACLYLDVRATVCNGINMSKYLFVFGDLRSVPLNAVTGDNYGGWIFAIFLSYLMFSKILLFYTDYLRVS